MYSLAKDNIVYNIGVFQHSQLESSKMTAVYGIGDNPTMTLSAQEIIEKLENARVIMQWSKREMARKADVPYSWVVDLYRNKPQKPDMKRVQQIMIAVGIMPREGPDSPLLEKFKKALPIFEESEKRMFEHMIDSIIGTKKKEPQ